METSSKRVTERQERFSCSRCSETGTGKSQVLDQPVPQSEFKTTLRNLVRPRLAEEKKERNVMKSSLGQLLFSPAVECLPSMFEEKKGRERGKKQTKEFSRH